MKSNINFSLREEEILRILLKNQNTYISAKKIADYINEECWLIKETDEEKIVTAIYRLNRKLKFSKIFNKRGIGYRVARRI